MIAGMQKNGADQTIQYPKTQYEEQDQDITEQTLLELKYNKGTWHIFTPGVGNQKCMCGSTKKSDYSRNHCSKNRTAQKILDQPSQGLGKTASNGLRKLQNKVKQP